MVATLVLHVQESILHDHVEAEPTLTICSWTHRHNSCHLRVLHARSRKVGRHPCCLTHQDKNGTDIFRPYSRPNPFRGVQICLYSSPDIQHLIPYPNPTRNMKTNVISTISIRIRSVFISTHTSRQRPQTCLPWSSPSRHRRHARPGTR
jgi:hypothetical protein